MSRIGGRPEISTHHVYGLTLRVARWRAGASGTPLLFLNGIGADIAAAAPLLAQIHGREVWTLDMPGVGGSPDAILPYSAPTMAAIVMEIADRFDQAQIDLAGFSWGGALAQQIAEASGGQVLPPTAVAEVLALTNLEPIVAEKTETIPLWVQWKFLWIVFGCLFTEWSIRKYLGLS